MCSHSDEDPGPPLNANVSGRAPPPLKIVADISDVAHAGNRLVLVASRMISVPAVAA